MATRNAFAKKVASEVSVTFTFADGKTLTCGIDELQMTTINRLAVHGLAQKVGDSYAGAESVSEARAAAESTWEALLRGEWTSRTRGGVLAQAIADVMGKPLEEILEVLRNLDEKQQAALRKEPRIAKRVLEIQQEKLDGRPTMDLGSLFS